VQLPEQANTVQRPERPGRLLRGDSLRPPTGAVGAPVRSGSATTGLLTTGNLLRQQYPDRTYFPSLHYPVSHKGRLQAHQYIKNL
jgi:hypothetical protein